MTLVTALYAASIGLVLLGIATAVLKRNMIKKIIGFGILSNGVHLMLITTGFRAGGISPVVTPANIAEFASLSVDPLPQALVLTSIVIDLSITTLALMIIIWVYKNFGTIDSDRITSGSG
jgi:multicomponent Na+:H+ antiporter subunit C